MSPEALTALGATVISAVALIVLPIIFRRQSAAQAKADREILAAQAKVDRDAIADAAKASSDAVTMDTINKAIASERDRVIIAREKDEIEHRRQLLELQAHFTAETDRLKQRTGEEIDKAHERIRRLDEEIAALRRRLPPEAVREVVAT